LELLLQHSDEAVRVAAQHAINSAILVHEASDSEPDSTASCSDSGWVKPSAADAFENDSALSDTDEWQLLLAEDAVQDQEENEEQPESPAPFAPSARVLGSSVEFGAAADATFDFPDARGDVTGEFAGLLEQYPKVGQAFRLCRLYAPHDEPTASAVAKAVVTNDGNVPWPESSMLQCVAGPAYAFPDMQLGAVPAGETVELVLDLAFGLGQPGEATLSAWAMVDEHGEPFGPLLLLEVARG
jgi:hypothetical protein